MKCALLASDGLIQSIKKQSQQTVKQTEVSSPNHSIMNKQQGDQIQFSPEKRL